MFKRYGKVLLVALVGVVAAMLQLHGVAGATGGADVVALPSNIDNTIGTGAITALTGIVAAMVAPALGLKLLPVVFRAVSKWFRKAV